VNESSVIRVDVQAMTVSAQPAAVVHLFTAHVAAILECQPSLIVISENYVALSRGKLTPTRRVLSKVVVGYNPQYNRTPFGDLRLSEL